MKSLAGALLAATASALTLSYANKICISNEAGFVMYWWMNDLDTGNNGPNSPNYPTDQTECMAISLSNLKEGDIIAVYIQALAGALQSTTSSIIYQKSPAITASFICRGTTFNYSCNLNGQAYLEQLEMHGMYAEMLVWKSAEDIE